MTVQIWPVMTGIAIRSSKSQKWNTTVEKSGSGRMRSTTNQLLPSWSISIKYAVPSYVKRDGKYEVARRGAVVVEIMQSQIVAEAKKGK